MLEYNRLEVNSDDKLVGLVLSESSMEYNKFLLLEAPDKGRVKANFIQRSLKAIQEKFFNNEFKMILETKGDIKALKGYNNIAKALDIMNKELTDKEQRKRFIELKKCLDNLEKYSRNFKLYIDKNDMIISIYATTVSALIASTSALAVGSFEYEVKSTGTKIKPIKQRVDSDITFNSVVNFNKMVSDGSLNKLFSQVKNEISSGGTTNNFLGINAKDISKYLNSKVDETNKFKDTAMKNLANTFSGKYGAVATVSAAIAISTVAVFAIRETVYYFYYFRNSIAAYLENLSSFVEINATKNVPTNSKTREKQLEIANKLSTFSQKIGAYNKSVDRKIKSEISKEESQVKEKNSELDVYGSDILL